MNTQSPDALDYLSRLYSRGSTALENRSSDAAIQDFLHCLHLLLSHPSFSPRMLALVLYSLGKALGYRFKATQTAIACCEASAEISKRAGRTEPDADRIYMAASVILILEDYSRARRLLQLALDRYRAVNALSKVRLLQTELRDLMSRLGERRYREISGEAEPITPIHLVITESGHPVYHITVGRDGSITHESLARFDLFEDTLNWNIEVSRT